MNRALLICTLLIPLPIAAFQGQPTKAGVPVEVVATAYEYVPRTTTISHPGHSFTNCSGDTFYFGQFASTSTQCSSTISPPTETTLITYQRVNYTIVKGEQALYLLSCTQLTGSPGERVRSQGLIETIAERDCPAFTIGSKYTLTIRNTSDARLVDSTGAKPRKLEYLSSAGLPLPTTQSAVLPRPKEETAPERARVHITSSPTGGEIYVDGKFIGNTPSDIALAAGEHLVKITIGGKDWSRTIQITSGEVSLHADMPSH